MTYDFINEIYNMLADEIEDSIASDFSAASIDYECNGGNIIEVSIDSNNEVNVEFLFEDNKNKEYPNIVDAIIDNSPDWNKIQEKFQSYDEWNDHGFANESDYLNYRYG